MSATGSPYRERAHFASTGNGYYPIIVGAFVGLLLISNIGAVKLIALGPLITDGGALLFHLTYIVGDVLSEVYGLRAARRAILLGFAMSIVAALTFWLVQLSPPADGWGNQEAFEAVIGYEDEERLVKAMAYVVLKSGVGDGALAERIVAHCKRELVAYKALRRCASFLQ